jgi:hypothetical protein
MTGPIRSMLWLNETDSAGPEIKGIKNLQTFSDENNRSFGFTSDTVFS